jgi:hypothetical protein
MLIKAQRVDETVGIWWFMDNLNVDGAEQVFKVVDNVLRQVIGEKATLLVYKYLESRFSLRTNEFSTKTEVLAEGLRFFLCSGAPLVERKILKDLYSSCGVLDRMQLAKAGEEYDFASQVRFALKNAN